MCVCVFVCLCVWGACVSVYTINEHLIRYVLTIKDHKFSVVNCTFILVNYIISNCLLATYFQRLMSLASSYTDLILFSFSLKVEQKLGRMMTGSNTAVTLQTLVT